MTVTAVIQLPLFFWVVKTILHLFKRNQLSQSDANQKYMTGK